MNYFILHFIQIAAIAFYLHPIHVSVTEIEFDEKDKALEIMMRVFIDDLETTFRNRNNQSELDFYDPKNGEIVDGLVKEYLQDHFKVTLDNKAQKITYLGHEREEEAFIFYVEVSGVRKWKTISVLNNIIMETYDDQSNLVHVTVGGKIRSLRLTKDTPQDKLSF